MLHKTDSKARQPNSGRQLEVFEHLTELRARLIRSAAYVCLGACAGWFLYDIFFNLLSAPVTAFLKTNGGSFLLTGIAEGFTIKMQMSLLIGLILALPLVSWEGWAFIAPGLTKAEKHGVKLVAPLSILLFLVGVLTAYLILPKGITWLAEQNPPGAKFMPSVQGTLMFILKMCLAFGIVFQLPVVLMFLAKIHIIDSRLLKVYWRQAILVMVIIAAVITPSNDAFTMLMMCIPMIVLYGLSIWLVRLMER